MSIELTVTIKDAERKLTKDFNIYEMVTFVDTDPVIAKCVQEVIDEFKGEPEDIKIKAIMVLK